MKKIALILIALMFSINAWAATDKKDFLVHTDDGVVLTAYVVPSVDSPGEALEAAGYGSNQVREIDESVIPVDETEYRNFWYWNPATEKIEVDNAKKQEWLDDVAAAEAERDAILAKIIDKIPGLTAQELEDIGVKKPVKIKKEK